MQKNNKKKTKAKKLRFFCKNVARPMAVYLSARLLQL